MLLLIVMLWIGLMFALGNVAIPIIAISAIFFASRGYYVQILCGFWVILMLSDSQLPWLQVAGVLKIALILTITLIILLKREELLQEGNPVLLPFIPFFIWSFCLVLNAPDVLKSFQKTLSYLLMFWAIPHLVTSLLRKDARTFMRAVVFLFMLYLVFGLLARYVYPDVTFLVGRYRGFMGNPNGMGILVLMMIIVHDNFTNKIPDLLSRIESIIIWSLLIISLLATQSRSALFTIGIYMLFTRVRPLRGFIGLLFFIVAVVGYSYLLEKLPEIVMFFGLEEYLRLDTLEEASGRLIAWNFALENIQESMFIGRGFNFTEYLFAENYYLLSRMGHLGNAHNTYLTIWLDTGIVGLALFVIALFLVFFRTSKNSSFATATMYAIGFSVFYESWLSGSLNPFTIAFLIILSTQNYLHQKEEVTEEEIEADESEFNLAHG